MSHDNVTPINKNQKKPYSFFQCGVIYCRLCVFSASPSDLPYNLICILKSFIIFCAISIFFMIDLMPLSDIFIFIAIKLFLLVGIVKFALKIIDKPDRFVQTLSALIGVGMVMSLISALIYFFISPDLMYVENSNNSVSIITLIIVLWNLAVIAHVFKDSFEIGFLLANFFSISYFILFRIIISISLLGPA